MNDFILPLAIILVLASLFGFIARLWKQPILLGYIAAGALLAPLGVAERLGDTQAFVDSMGRIGVVFLLFLVGIELSVDQIRALGKVALATGLGQIVFTSIIGFILALLLGFSPVSSGYLAIALTFSSTIIIVKLLTEKRDLQSLYGKIAIGFLLVQDFVAIAILALLSGFSGGFYWASLLIVAGKAIALIFVIWWVGKRVMPTIVPLVAHSDEALFTVSIAWCIALAAIVASPFVGFSIEIGGFLAGFALSSVPQHQQIASRVRPLRDFFITLFFVYLGTGLAFSSISRVLLPAIVFSVFVLFGNPLIVMAIMGYLGYRKRTSFLTSLTVAQISEFSLVVVALGVSLGHIPREILSVTMLVGMITMTLSTYAILDGNALYTRLKSYLNVFERQHPVEGKIEIPRLSGHAILFGHNRAGRYILPVLKELGLPYLVVDFDPSVVSELSLSDTPVIYGDAGDIEFLKDLNLVHAKLITSTISDIRDNEMILSLVGKPKERTTTVIMTAATPQEAKKLYELGADYVMVPRLLGGEHIAHLIQSHEFTRTSVATFAARHHKVLYQTD